MRSRPNMRNVTLSRVNRILKEHAGRSGDSRRISEIYEVVLELLAILREMRTDGQRKLIAQRVRSLDKRVTESSARDRTP
jgi:hypothetical protein